MSIAPKTVTGLEELMTAIRGFDDPRRASDEWKQVYRLLQKTELPPASVTHVVGMRDVAGLAAMIEQLRDPTPVEPAEVPDNDTCRKALKSFRKRLSLTILDEESKLGRGPLSKGAASGAAIVPPNEWPESVWQELVRQGKLRYIGHRLYELTNK